jgi:Undecaprenyl-phosphate glucose phosphotransferase
LNSCLLILNWLRLGIYFSDPDQLIIYFIHLNFSWVLAFFTFSKQNIHLRDGFTNRLWRISKRLLIYISIASITAFLFLPKYYSRHFFVEHTTLFYLGTIGAYYIIYKYLKYKRKKGLNTIRAVIITNCDTAFMLRKIIDINPILGYKFLGFIVHNNTPSQQDVLGLADNLEQLIAEHQIQMIFSIQNSANQAFNKSIITRCDKFGVKLRFVPENNRLYKAEHNTETIAGIALINPRAIPLDDLGSRIWKRLFDIFFSLFLILFLFTWLFPIIAIIIKLSSKGPILFLQKRTGINRRTFTCLKFRSMNQNVFSDSLQASENDTRITFIGHYLRKTNIDELPQFINVFLGDMSVVGPRPHMLMHTDHYSKLIKHYLIRQYVKPGVTGWAQINGFRGETDELWKMEKRVKYDMNYIKNWTFIWDLKIIFMTLFGRNALRNAG